MKKEIKRNDLNTNRNSLFTLNKIQNNNLKRIQITQDRNNIKTTSIKETQDGNKCLDRKNSDKNNTKEKDFNRKLKSFIKLNNSNPSFSNNNSVTNKKEGSSIKSKPTPIRNNNLTNLPKTNKNYEISNNSFLTTNSNEHFNLENNSVDFNTIEDHDPNIDRNKTNIEKRNQLKKSNKPIYTSIEKKITPNIRILDENSLNSTNSDNNDKSKFFNSLDNSDKNKRGSFFNTRSVEERKSFLPKNDNINFNMQLKTNIIDLNSSSRESVRFLGEKNKLLNIKNFFVRSNNSQSSRGNNSKTSLSKNTSKLDKNNSVNKINGNSLINLKHKIDNKNNNNIRVSQIVKKIPNINISSIRSNKIENKKYFTIQNKNENSIRSQKNIINLNDSKLRNRKNQSIGLSKTKILQNNKSHNINLLSANLNKSNESLNIKKDYKNIKEKNHVQIIDENNRIINSEFKNNEEKKSTKSFRNISTKSIFNFNQSNKFLINLLNSSESNYSDKFVSIVNKFKLFILKLISSVFNQETDDNISIFKNISNTIFNASFSNTEIDYSELIFQYCQDSKTEFSQLNIINIANNLGKNIKFQIEDVFSGISPIILDCNMIKQEFMDCNTKSKTNFAYFELSNEDIIQENIEQISKKSEQRCEKIKVLFKEMKDNLDEVSNLLVNEFAQNLNTKLEGLKSQDHRELFNKIEDINIMKNSNNKTIDNVDKDNNNNYISIGYRENQSKNKSIKIRKTSKIIEIDLSNDKKKFDKIYNLISDNRKSLREILQYEENSEFDDFNYLKTDTNENNYSNILKAQNKIVEEDINSELSDKSIGQKILCTEQLSYSILKRSNVEKAKISKNLRNSQNKKPFKENELLRNVKSNKKSNLIIKNIELVKNRVNDKAKKKEENKLNTIKCTTTNTNIRNKFINENKENNKKLINKKNLENIRIESTIELSTNNSKDKISNGKIDSGIASHCNNNEILERNSFENNNLSNQSLNNKEYEAEKKESNKFMNTSNYININFKINASHRRNTLEYKLISNLNNQTLIRNISKSDINLSSFDFNDPKSRNANIKFNLENLKIGNVSYYKFTQLANQRKSQIGNKIKHDKINKQISLSKDLVEESDLMESIDEFDSGEKRHFDIPLSSINYAHMPICGSRIIRRHSSFSKLLERFNYKRFFNFRKSSYLSPTKIQTAKNNTNKNDAQNSNATNNNKNNLINKSTSIYTNNEEKLTPEIKDFNLKKIEVFDSENYSDMNSSAPDLSLSNSEVCYNDIFNCCDNIEINNKFSFINFNKTNEKYKKNNPNRRKSRSVMNLMIVNLNKD